MNEKQAEIMDYLYKHPWSTKSEIYRNIDFRDKGQLHYCIKHLLHGRWIKSRVRESTRLIGKAKNLGDRAKPHEYDINNDINRKISLHEIYSRYGTFKVFIGSRYR